MPETKHEAGAAPYMLRLFITGTTPRSTRALINVKLICEQHLRGFYKLEVIDVYQQPELAMREQLVALPTLVKQLPEPMRRLVGDMTDTEQVLVGLDIRQES